jgi:hypothetical protein
MQRAIFTIKTIHLLPRFKNRVFNVELVSLTFFAASGYPATAGLTYIIHEISGLGVGRERLQKWQT